uniref:Uncharacterized protein n=1 Tax=Hucho hucho TaxID=62062 RepID=A0A4W5KW32_9TELE
MVLFYLQQRNPPVIPVLQEIYDEEEKPEVLVDGWNVYFYDDLNNLVSPSYQSISCGVCVCVCVALSLSLSRT